MLRAVLRVCSCLILLLGESFGSTGKHKKPEPVPDFLGDPLPAGAVARLGSTRLWHPHTEAIFLSAEGRTLTTLSIQFDPSEQLPSRSCKWEVATGKLLQETRLPPYRGNSFNVSTDGMFLARYVNEGNKQRLVIWDLARNQEIKGPSRDFRHSFTFQAVLPDRKTLIYRDNDDRHQIFWDIATKKEIKRLGPIVPSGERYKIQDSLLSRDGKRVVWFLKNAGEQLIQVIDEGRKTPLLQRSEHLNAGLDQATLSPDGQYLAWNSDWNTLHLLDLTDETNHTRVQVPRASLHGLTFSPNGKILYSGPRKLDHQLS